MKEDPAIPDYILASLNETASEKQKTLTETWLTDEDNREQFVRMKKIMSLSQDVHLFGHFDLKDGKREISRRIARSGQIRLIRSIERIAAFLLLPALIFGCWAFIRNPSVSEVKTVQINQQIQTQPGIRSSLVLPDGSKVWLNSASTLRFPSVFTGRTRTVELEGEAYFEVAKNAQQPFVVKSGLVKVTALGTAFNLCAYPGEERISATLAEGKIKVKTEGTTSDDYILRPNELLEFDQRNSDIRIQWVRAYDNIAWKDGKLIFNETPFHEVVQKLGRWFNTDIRLADESIANYRYTATFTNENLSQVMELLTYSAPIEFSTTNRKMIGHNNNFSPKQIIIRAKPGTKKQVSSKNSLPM